ncbi:hypothetical protein JYU34_012616 [Plutella xylostella]|uniref:Elongator complex protein 6 n=1 Tax=Plutella xylostella TaxID=51655 RepID=A0ABQ7QBS5_PLUXY|nr:hypothetical protein JYU34_012616 [Plutella xylostella]
MASDILSILKLDPATTSSSGGKVIVAKELNGCESTFIISSFFGEYYRSSTHTLLVLLHNPLSHYQNVSLRMNYNLQKLIDSGHLEVCDLAKESVDNLLTGNSQLKDMGAKVMDKLTEMKKKCGEVTVIVDGLSHLFDLEYSLSEVNEFCRSVIRSRGEGRSHVVLHCHVASEDHVTNTCANMLCHMADTVVVVENLSSGLSADVSGHLKVTYPGQKFVDDVIDIKSVQYLFRLFDKGVKVFAPGCV